MVPNGWTESSKIEVKHFLTTHSAHSPLEHIRRGLPNPTRRLTRDCINETLPNILSFCVSKYDQSRGFIPQHPMRLRPDMDKSNSLTKLIDNNDTGLKRTDNEQTDINLIEHQDQKQIPAWIKYHKTDCIVI